MHPKHREDISKLFGGESLLVQASGKAHLNKTLRNAAKDEEFLRSVGLRFLDQYDIDDIRSKLHHYFKFMVVSHPIMRLNIAYKDFMLSKSGLKFSNTIKDHFPYVNVTDMGVGNFSLSQFVELVNNGNLKDIHWAPLHDLCHPCDISYDRIIKLESFERDVTDLLQTIDILSNLTTTEALLNNVQRQVKYEDNTSLLDLPNATVAEVMKHYHKDMQLFGYSWNAERVNQYHLDAVRTLKGLINIIWILLGH